MGELGEAQERGGSELTEGTSWRKCPGLRGQQDAWTSRLVSLVEVLRGWSTGWGRMTSGKEEGEEGWPSEPQEPEG